MWKPGNIVRKANSLNALCWATSRAPNRQLNIKDYYKDLKYTKKTSQGDMFYNNLEDFLELFIHERTWLTALNVSNCKYLKYM